MTDTRSLVDRFSDEDLVTSLRVLIDADLILLSRASVEYESTHPIEDVSVSVGADLLELVCKYSSPGVDPVTGHNRGVTYEAEIYRSAFPDVDLATPAFYGTFGLVDSIDCIVLQHVSGFRVQRAPEPRSLLDVCADLGRFHSRVVGILPPVHNVFSRSHFSRLTSEMELLPGVSARLRGAGSTVVDVLSNDPRTLIHGELYPANVLINEEGPVVIDWECAGVGPGVLDLAMLTQGSWDPDLVDECEEVYWRERRNVTAGVGRRILAAGRIMAAGLLLLHLRGQETDGVQEGIALETIGAQASRLRGELA